MPKEIQRRQSLTEYLSNLQSRLSWQERRAPHGGNLATYGAVLVEGRLPSDAPLGARYLVINDNLVAVSIGNGAWRYEPVPPPEAPPTGPIGPAGPPGPQGPAGPPGLDG